MLEVPTGTHNDTWLKAGDEYVTKIRAFLERCHKENVDKEWNEAPVSSIKSSKQD